VRPPPLQAIDGLAAIGLDELDAVAALRRRFDAKYLLSRDALPGLLERLAPTHRVLEIEGGRAFEYRTTYFDTPELGAFRDHLQGRRRRLKVRVRHYAHTDDCFLELKLRGPHGATIKRRQPCDARLRDRLDADSLAALARWVDEANRRRRRRSARPSRSCTRAYARGPHGGRAADPRRRPPDAEAGR
jgi:hypothetical protein